jgi:hypothetical protein
MEIMKTVRPYEATDNELNKAMAEVLKRYTQRHGLEIKEIEIYECGVAINTEGNQRFSMNITESSYACNRQPSDYMYMKTTINGKQKRIPKSEW